jgi:hypothetical protein
MEEEGEARGGMGDLHQGVYTVYADGRGWLSNRVVEIVPKGK